MKWKTNKEKEKDTGDDGAATAVAAAAAATQPTPGVGTKKQSISSNQSMPFLRDDNLTFHRFAPTEAPSIKSGCSSNDPTPSANYARSAPVDVTDSAPRIPATTANTMGKQHSSPKLPSKNGADGPPFSSGTGKELSSFPGSVWTTNTGTLTATIPHRGDHHNSMYKNSYTIEANDFQYIGSNSRGGSLSERRKSSPQQNGSTAKLMLADDDQANKQSKCSLLRGIIFCLCLNFTYANVVRFPRELERHGAAFLVPYFAILLLVGLPVILLEISLGQFLGQGSAHSWRASPILKGASVVARLACWLGGVWTSMHAVIAVIYIGELVFKTVPFTQCVVKVRLIETTGYMVVSKDGQECLEHILQTPVWEHQLYYALLSIGLVIIWVTAMICTYNSKMLRRSIFFFGICSLSLLAFLSGWNVADFINRDTGVSIAEMWPFDPTPLTKSAIWFSALVQVICSSGIGVGVWPAVTGKFLYKGDAVRTSMIYMCFNVFIVTLSVTFFMTQYQNPTTLNSTITMAELKPLTAIYDAATNEPDPMLARLIPGLAYLLVVLVTIIPVAISIYTTSRFFTRHPNIILGLLGLVASVGALIGPKYIAARLLDAEIVGILVIVSLIFDIMSITWIYGAKNIYTDLEFSIGRPILKVWVFMWCITPILLTGLLTWWCVDLELFTVIPPRWSPIVVALLIIVLVACMQVYRQVDYNCCSMIQEAAQASTNWGPADPIVRHAWKQWRSVCEDTGQKDFTLRRRGTRDYTHSIKKGQYSRAKYGMDGVRKASSTVGSSSPNYSGSIYDDSAIEEDGSIEKFPQSTGTLVINRNGGDSLGKSYRYPVEPHMKNKLSDVPETLHQKQYFYVQPATATTTVSSGTSLGEHYHNVSKVEIVPEMGRPYAKNPLARLPVGPIAPTSSKHHYNSTPASGHSHRVSVEQEAGSSHSVSQQPANASDHICWRKFSVNTDEFSTEL